MKIKNEYKVKTVAGEKIVVPLGKESQVNRGVFKLNEEAACLFNIFIKKIDNGAGVNALVENFGADESSAKKDVEDFIQMLIDFKMVE